MPEEQLKVNYPSEKSFNWKKLLITISIFIVIAAVGGVSWYYLSTNCNHKLSCEDETELIDNIIYENLILRATWEMDEVWDYVHSASYKFDTSQYITRELNKKADSFEGSASRIEETEYPEKYNDAKDAIIVAYRDLAEVLNDTAYIIKSQSINDIDEMNEILEEMEPKIDATNYDVILFDYEYFSTKEYTLSTESKDKTSRDSRRFSDLVELELYLKKYYESNQQYPDNLQELAPAYMNKIPQDPLTNEDYSYKASTSKKDYELNAILENSEKGEDTERKRGAKGNDTSRFEMGTDLSLI